MLIKRAINKRQAKNGGQSRLFFSEKFKIEIHEIHKIKKIAIKLAICNRFIFDLDIVLGIPVAHPL